MGSTAGIGASGTGTQNTKGRATGALVASSALTLASAYGESEALKIQGQFAKSVSRANARFARLQARDVRVLGDIAIAEAGLDTAARIGQARAGTGASGVAVGTGSRQRATEAIQARGRENQIKIDNSVWRQQWAIKTSALQLAAQGQFAAAAANIEARNTLLTGGVSVARDIQQFRSIRARTPTTTTTSKAPGVS